MTLKDSGLCAENGLERGRDCHSSRTEGHQGLKKDRRPGGSEERQPREPRAPEDGAATAEVVFPLKG